MVQDRVEQRLQVVGETIGTAARLAFARDGVQDWKLELGGVGRQVEEEIGGRLEHPVGARVPPIDLVDHHDRAQSELERLLQDEARLRHRPLGRVDDQQRAVGHAEHPLDLAPKIGVPRRIDDVQSHFLVRAVVAIRHADNLRQDRHALFAFERVARHAVEREAALAELEVDEPGLGQHRVHQAGLAVVDVGNDGYVADVGAGRGHKVL